MQVDVPFTRSQEEFIIEVARAAYKRGILDGVMNATDSRVRREDIETFANDLAIAASFELERTR